MLQLCHGIKDNKNLLQKALASDLGRPEMEANFLEIGASISEALGAYKSVNAWAKPEKAPFSINFGAMKGRIRKEPKGVILIIIPFNYPIWLTMVPLAGAIAAGNAVVVKPSELAPACAQAIEEIFTKYLDPAFFRVVHGEIPETTALLDLPWDHVMYTGNGNVGKIVATACAKHLTPVTLELGGKSPVVIDSKMDMKLAARRLLWGKTVNAGQTCVAPDYILIPKEAQSLLVEELRTVYKEFYPSGAKESDSFSRIISSRHFQRLSRLLAETKGNVVFGGDTDEDSKYIGPTVVENVTGDDSLMSEELFGPILPIVPVDSIQQAIDFINARDHPLALYVFSNDAKVKQQVLDNTQSGGAAVNETVIHLGVPGLPFGGIGNSGSGYHTGKAGFDTFTHLRSTIDNPGWVDKILGFRYPPYTSKNLSRANMALFPSLPARSGESNNRFGRYTSLLVFALGLVMALKGPSGLLKLWPASS